MLKLNLQFFNDGGDDDFTADSLDFDTMVDEFESEWEESTDDTEVEEPTETVEEEVEPTEETQNETQTNPNDPDEHRRNQAFAELRRQADENRKYAEFLQRLAKDAGVQSPDDIMSQYEQRRLAQEAEQKGIPLEFYQQQHETQNRLQQLEERYRAERLDSQVAAVQSKYGANEDSLREAFVYMLQSGVDPRAQDTVDFERFYRAANLDSIIQREVEQARQKDLANKKSRQESAAIGNGSSVSQSNPNEISDEEVDAILKRMDIKI